MLAQGLGRLQVTSFKDRHKWSGLLEPRGTSALLLSSELRLMGTQVYTHPTWCLKPDTSVQAQAAGGAMGWAGQGLVAAQVVLTVMVETMMMIW